MKTPLPQNEKKRLEALYRYNILDTIPEQEFDDLTHIAAQICGTPMAMISLVDKERQWFKSKVGISENETSRDLAFCSHGILEDEFFIVNDASQDTRFANNPLVISDPSIRFYAGAPIRTGDGYTLGMLCVNDRVPRKLTEEQLNGLKSLARIAMHQIELRTNVSALEERSRDISLLSEMGELLQTAETVDEAYKVISQFLPKLFSNEIGNLYVLNSSKNILESVTDWGPLNTGGNIFAPEDCIALRRGRMYWVEDVATGLICRHVDVSSATQGYLCIPMIAQGDALGVVHLRSDTKTAKLTESKRKLAVTISEQVGLALANLRLRENLRIQSIRDPLSGLFNRRFLEETLERELRRAIRNKNHLGLIMMDIDHFKRFNDTYGHEAGDAMIREMGYKLRKYFRAEDITCRYGGEEFTIIIPDSPLATVLKRAETLREEVKHLDIQCRGQSLGCISISLGLSIAPQHGTTPEQLLQAADAALYRAKEEGRDRVVISDNFV